jgi:hypothetical protein
VVTAASIADDLLGTALDVLDELSQEVAPGLVLPDTLAGHRVDADAHADLAFTLGLLHEAGVEEVAGLPVVPALHRLLAGLDAQRTHTFFSYRVAETAHRLGGLQALDSATRDVVVAAADSTDWIPLLHDVVPRNYAVVLARCEVARRRLGLDVDPTTLDDLLERVRALFTEHPEGWLDDSHDGRWQVDMYTVDAYLFAEPFAEEIGDAWNVGVRSAARLVEAVASPGGQALPWGRSIGALAVCHTAELAGVLLRHGLVLDAGRWLGLARAAAEAAPGWFSGGLIAAHKRRAPFRYRGPHRRLQMTLDCTGKLVGSALDLRRAESAGGDDLASTPAAEPADTFDARDEWIGFGDGLGVWAHRDSRLSFTLPVVGGPGADYAPAPRLPRVFEVPTDRPIVCFVPLAWRGGTRFAPAGAARHIAHTPGRLEMVHERFVATDAELGTEPATIGGQRHARYRADGRALTVEEDMTFADVPGALAVLVPETADQPLSVTADGDPVRRVTTIDIDGLAEWRSVTGELRVVHQIELTPAPRVAFRWSAAPKLRVMSTAHHHWYHQCLYGPLRDRVDARPVPYHLLDRPDRLAETLAGIDVFHLHWPEWLVGLDAERSRRVAATLEGIGVPIVWTQHNLAPHAEPDNTGLYQPWADIAQGVIHHSEWGRAAVCARYRFRDDARHRVIPHGHWGPLMGESTKDATGDALGPDTTHAPGDLRRTAEAELGLRPCSLRIGLVGAPRPGKDTQLLIDGFAACRRDDIQLLVLCHDGERLPDDPRITALPYDEVPRAVYDRRLSAIDLLALPLQGGTYLTTGLVADAVGAGIPALISPWPYLREVLGDAAIPFGQTASDLARTLDSLDDAALGRARDAIAERRTALHWSTLAEPTWRLLDEVAAEATPARPSQQRQAP